MNSSSSKEVVKFYYKDHQLKLCGCGVAFIFWILLPNLYLPLSLFHAALYVSICNRYCFQPLEVPACM
jgi:hypothetical protein